MSGYSSLTPVVCVHCNKNLTWGQSRAGCDPPLFVCCPCAKELAKTIGRENIKFELVRLYGSSRSPQQVDENWEQKAKDKRDDNLRSVFG